MIRIVIFIFGLVISTMAGVAVYEPVDAFVGGVEDMYFKVQAFEDTISTGTDGMIDSFTDKYNEIARLFGKEVAEKEVKEEVIGQDEQSKLLDAFFEKDIAKWVSFFVGLLVMSLYLNIISFFAFLLKPVLFLVPKKK